MTYDYIYNLLILFLGTFQHSVWRRALFGDVVFHPINSVYKFVAELRRIGFAEESLTTPFTPLLLLSALLHFFFFLLFPFSLFPLFLSCFLSICLSPLSAHPSSSPTLMTSSFLFLSLPQMLLDLSHWFLPKLLNATKSLRYYK